MTTTRRKSPRGGSARAYSAQPITTTMLSSAKSTAGSLYRSRPINGSLNTSGFRPVNRSAGQWSTHARKIVPLPGRRAAEYSTAARSPPISTAGTECVNTAIPSRFSGIMNSSSSQSGPKAAITSGRIGRRGSRCRRASATAAWPAYTSARGGHRRRAFGSRRTRSSSCSIAFVRARSCQSAMHTISAGMTSANSTFRGCNPQRYPPARMSTSRSIADTQAFGADRLRRCAQLSHSVALAASCAPQLPHSE